MRQNAYRNLEMNSNSLSDDQFYLFYTVRPLSKIYTVRPYTTFGNEYYNVDAIIASLLKVHGNIQGWPIIKKKNKKIP